LFIISTIKGTWEGVNLVPGAGMRKIPPSPAPPKTVLIETRYRGPTSYALLYLTSLAVYLSLIVAGGFSADENTPSTPLWVTGG
jgi:hypothetical protein